MKAIHRLQIFIACFFLTMLAMEATGFSVTTMTFEDLFHTDAKAAKELFGEDTFRRLQKALDDFNAVLAGKAPVAAFDKALPQLLEALQAGNRVVEVR